MSIYSCSLAEFCTICFDRYKSLYPYLKIHEAGKKSLIVYQRYTLKTTNQVRKTNRSSNRDGPEQAPPGKRAPTGTPTRQTERPDAAANRQIGPNSSRLARAAPAARGSENAPAGSLSGPPDPPDRPWRTQDVTMRPASPWAPEEEAASLRSAV